MSFLVWPLAIQSVPFPAKSVTLGVPKIRWKISCFNPRPTKCTLQDLTEFHISFRLFILEIELTITRITWIDTAKHMNLENCHQARKFSPQSKQVLIYGKVTLFIVKFLFNKRHCENNWPVILLNFERKRTTPSHRITCFIVP